MAVWPERKLTIKLEHVKILQVRYEAGFFTEPCILRKAEGAEKDDESQVI